MEKIGTPECQLFIAAHYAQSKIDTLSDDWILEKKYKNFHGFTCRDFFNEKLDLRAVVVAETKSDRYQLSVLENSSYKHYLDEMSKKPLYYYAPVVTNDGLVFYFEKTMTYDATGVLDEHRTKQYPYLLKKLQTLFKPDEMISFKEDMIVAFPKHALEDVLQILERNNLSFNTTLFDLLEKNRYIPFFADVSLSIYEFPEDSALNVEEGIEVVFSLVSQARELTNEEYARIKKLFNKVPLEEIESVKNIVLGFRNHPDTKLDHIIQDQINDKLNKNLWLKLLEK